MKSLNNFLMGLGAGMALAMLYAPRPGIETRNFLMQKGTDGVDSAKRAANDGVDYVKRQADDLKKSAANGIDRVKTAAMAPIEGVSSAIEAGKQAYGDAVGKANA